MPSWVGLLGPIYKRPLSETVKPSKVCICQYPLKNSAAEIAAIKGHYGSALPQAVTRVGGGISLASLRRIARSM